MQRQRTPFPTAATGVGFAAVVLAAGVLAAGCTAHHTSGSAKSTATSSGKPEALTAHGVKESGKSSNQILADARRIALAARSVHVAGDLGNGVTLNMVFTAGGQAKGTLTQSGQTEQLLVLGQSTVYAATSKTGGRYGRLPQANAAQVSKSFSMNGVISDALTPDGTAVKDGVTEKGGSSQIALKDSSDGSMLYIADNAGSPYPLRITNKSGSGVVFSDWNKTVTVKVPGS